MIEGFKLAVDGHVLIQDASGNVLLDKKNAIHPKNMALAIARGLANEANHSIFRLRLGNGGTTIDASQQIVYNTPKVSDSDNDLYNRTYDEVVDDATGSGDNSVLSSAIAGTANSRVTITAVISPQDSIDWREDDQAGITGTVDPESNYFFDELGLFTQGTGSNDAGELMLSHLIFSPIEQTASRELTITYTLTISVS